MRMLTPIFGSTVYTSTIVVSTFMGGLAIGSFYCGRVIEKKRNAIFLFSLSQFGLALYTLFLPFVIVIVKVLYTRLSSFDNFSLHQLNILRFLLSSLILLLPSILIGVTIPVIAKEINHISNKKINLTQTKPVNSSIPTIGLVYSFNSFGGAIGSFLSGFVLISAIGINNSNYLAGGISFFISISAFIYWWKHDTPPVPYSTGLNKKTTHLTGDLSIEIKKDIKNILLLLTFAAGFTTLGYEILCLRLFIPILESTTYTFSIVLSVFIVGLAIGNLFYYKLFNTCKKPIFWGALAESVAGLYTFFSPYIFIHIQNFGNSLYAFLENPSWESTILIKIILTFTFLVIPTTVFGFLLPLVSSLFSLYIGKIGKGVGDTFSLNILGSILGSIITGFIFVPYLGVKNSFIILGLVNIIITMWLFFKITLSKRNFTISACSAGFILILIFFYFDKTSQLLPLPGEKIIYYKEGIAGNVEVSKNVNGFNILRVDNKTHGGNEPWVKTDETRIAHLSILLHQNPKKILLVGLGTGITLEAIALHNIDFIDCVEIVEGLRKTTNFFLTDNKVLIKKNIKIIIEDGRSYILRTKNKYDIIIMDLIHPESSGASNLFTEEYYKDSKDILKDKGFVIQWLPLYQLSPMELKIILRTFATIFPNTSLWFGSHNRAFPLVFLVGSKNKLHINKNIFRNRLNSSPLTNQIWEGENINKILNNFILDRKEILKFTKGVPLNTDDLNILEFLIPKGLIGRNRYGKENYFILNKLKGTNLLK